MGNFFSQKNFVCKYNHKNVWDYLVSTDQSYHNSQHMFDPFSVVHILGGAMIYLISSRFTTATNS